MNRFVPWTLVGILAGYVVAGSLAMAQWKPKEREPIKWFTPPPITEDDLNPDWEDQELCYLVHKDYYGDHFISFYTLRPHYPQNLKRDKWFLPPVVLKSQQKSVWEKLQEALSATFKEGNRWR